MLQLRSRFDLAEETFTAKRGCELGMQDLDGDIAIVFDVVREVHCRHAARPELALDAVVARQCCVQPIRKVQRISGLVGSPKIDVCEEIATAYSIVTDGFTGQALE